MTSCINIGVRRVGNPIDFTCLRAGSPLSVTCSKRTTPIDLSCSRVGYPMTASYSRVGKPLEFRCGLVCSVNSKFYLEVPADNIWLLPENDFSQDVVVYANVSWTIE